MSTNKSNNNNHNISIEPIDMDTFQSEMKRLKPGLIRQGRAIANRAKISSSLYTRYISGSGGTSLKGMETLGRILQSAKDIYKELLAEVDQ